MDIKAQIKLLKKLKSDLESMKTQEKTELYSYISDVRNALELEIDEIIIHLKEKNDKILREKENELKNTLEISSKKDEQIHSLLENLSKLTGFCNELSEKNKTLQTDFDILSLKEKEHELEKQYKSKNLDEHTKNNLLEEKDRIHAKEVKNKKK